MFKKIDESTFFFCGDEMFFGGGFAFVPPIISKTLNRFNFLLFNRG